MDYLQYLIFSHDAFDFLLIVLNLVINGLPSIRVVAVLDCAVASKCFKPCYKWITFNTGKNVSGVKKPMVVLNLVINGLPSIPKKGLNFGIAVGVKF